MKALNPIKLFVFITICLFPTAVVHRLSAQTVTWTSSHPDIVSVDTVGIIKMISEPAVTTKVTITAAVEQNGKTVTSSKTIQTDDCTSCFSYKAPSDSQARTYCGIRLSNGQCWMDRNIGAASTAEESQIFDTTAAAEAACPASWRLAMPAEFLEVIRLKMGNSSIDYTTSRNTITVDKMAAAPLIFAASSTNCPHIIVQGSGDFFNWGAGCPSNSYSIYRNNFVQGYYGMGVRCIKQ